MIFTANALPDFMKARPNHAITIITNEFHKFWCLFDFRENISKFDPKRTLFGPKGPNPADRHTFGGTLA